MKILCLIVVTFFTTITYSQDVKNLSADELKSRIGEVNKAFNKVFMVDSTMNDVEALFSNYTDDFVYIHEVYGGTYSRESLYNNTAIRVKERRYKRTSDRYKIISMIPGFNGVAVERELLDNGKRHLTVFEFRGDSVEVDPIHWTII